MERSYNGIIFLTEMLDAISSGSVAQHNVKYSTRLVGLSVIAGGNVSHVAIKSPLLRRLIFLEEILDMLEIIRTGSTAAMPFCRRGCSIVPNPSTGNSCYGVWTLSLSGITQVSKHRV
jgi:hypothetical protein